MNFEWIKQKSRFLMYVSRCFELLTPSANTTIPTLPSVNYRWGNSNIYVFFMYWDHKSMAEICLEITCRWQFKFSSSVVVWGRLRTFKHNFSLMISEGRAKLVYNTRRKRKRKISVILKMHFNPLAESAGSTPTQFQCYSFWLIADSNF